MIKLAINMLVLVIIMAGASVAIGFGLELGATVAADMLAP